MLHQPANDRNSAPLAQRFTVVSRKVRHVALVCAVVSWLSMSCKGTGQTALFLFLMFLLVASQTRICPVRMDSAYENHRQTKLNATIEDFLAFLFMPRALVCAQAFPPLLKQAGDLGFCPHLPDALCQAGGVAKDYLALCRALIDGLGWEVTLFSPVNIRESGEEDVTIPRCTMMKNFVSAAFVRTFLGHFVASQQRNSPVWFNVFCFIPCGVNFYWQYNVAN